MRLSPRSASRRPCSPLLVCLLCASCSGADPAAGGAGAPAAGPACPPGSAGATCTSTAGTTAVPSAQAGMGGAAGQVSGAAGTAGTTTATSGAGGAAAPDGSAGDVSPGAGAAGEATAGSAGDLPPTGGADEAPATAGSDAPATECGGGDTPSFALVGWATEAGGTTGGKGGDVIHVSDGAALQQALRDKQDSVTPLTILVSGRITEANSGVSKIDVKDVRDVSILGDGGGAELDGIGIKIVRAGNVVVRNLRIHHVDIGDKDGISIEGPADHVWIDHCEISAELQGVDKDYYDGLIDAKAEAEYITYSFNDLHDSWKTMLVGSSESDTFDRKLTLHHNYFHNCNSRLPLFRGGNGHVFNNFYEDVIDTGINARLGACLRVEGNSFRRAQDPWVSAYSDTLGAAELRCNLTEDVTFAYTDDVHELPACIASVPYAYHASFTAPELVPTLVPMYAGVGKLDDPEDF